MIDTLKFEIDKRHFDYNELHNHLYEKFQFEGKTTYKYGESIKFKHKNWLFWLTKNSLKASGSLNKLYHGNNLGSFSFSEIKSSLDSLYELLEFDISDAKIKQIDVGYNFKMSHDVNCYFDLLVPPTGFKRWKIGNETLYLKKNDNTSEITFYDKGKETKSKYNHLTVNSPNLLRYELKLKKNITKIINDDSLVSLYKFDTYLKLVDVWHENYLSVPKITCK